MCASSERLKSPVLPSSRLTAGIDFGKPLALGLPLLTILQELVIGLVRTDQVWLKLRAPVPGAGMTALKGSVISFVHDGPEKVVQNVDVKYPLLEQVQKGPKASPTDTHAPSKTSPSFNCGPTSSSLGFTPSRLSTPCEYK